MRPETDRLRARGRAISTEEKRAVIERLYRAWCAMPTLRLGQMIEAAIQRHSPADVFDTEDAEIAEVVEKLAREHGVAIEPAPTSIATVAEALARMTQEERIEATRAFCMYCWEPLGVRGRCYCMRDE